MDVYRGLWPNTEEEEGKFLGGVGGPLRGALEWVVVCCKGF